MLIELFSSPIFTAMCGALMMIAVAVAGGYWLSIHYADDDFSSIADMHEKKVKAKFPVKKH